MCVSHLQEIIEFYLCIQMLPAKMYVGFTLAGRPCICGSGLLLTTLTSGIMTHFFLKRGKVW